MSVQSVFRLSLWSAGAAAACIALSGCSDSSPAAHTPFPMGKIPSFDQPRPTQPLFGSDTYVRSHEILRPAKADLQASLPPAAPLVGQ